jgi:hypothetical protein
LQQHRKCEGQRGLSPRGTKGYLRKDPPLLKGGAQAVQRNKSWVARSGHKTPPNQDFDLQESRFEEKEAQCSRTISLKGF